MMRGIARAFGVRILGRALYVAYGDSITYGLNASTSALQWTNLVAAAQGWLLQNSGVAGSVLQNTVQSTVDVIGGSVAGNGRDTLATRVLVFEPTWVTILYGLNDLRLNDAAFSAAQFETDLGEIVDAIIAAGTAADHIVIGSPPYIPAASYSLFSPFDGGSAELHADYVAACAAVASAKGTLYADVYQAMADGGDDDLISGDGVHPNDTGHAVIADAFLTALH